MKRTILMSLAGLTLVAACTDQLTRPADVPNGRLAPRGPLLDDIANRLDTDIDAVAEVMPLNVGGANGTTKLYVTPRNDDGKSGCNIAGKDDDRMDVVLSLNVASSDPSVATVSPASVSFASCGDEKTLTITPIKVGSTTITVSEASNNSGATFNLAPASFTVNVATSGNTAPSVSITGVTGTSYNKGSVPEAVCNVTDAEDGPSSFAATLSAITGPYAADGIGAQTANCSYTDTGSLTATSSVTYNIVDPSAPVIGYALAPTSPDGNSGWYKSNVALTWSVTESESPSSLAKIGCDNQTITDDQTSTTYSCSATSAGGPASAVSVSIKRDATAPVLTPSVSPAANTNGWNNSNVTVSYVTSDATSGIATCDADDDVLSGEGAGQPASATCTDIAGNVGNAAVSINIDKTAPSVSLVGGPSNGASYYFGSVPAEPTCSASDGLSGLEGTCSVSGYGTTVGTHTVKAEAVDQAGNKSTTIVTYTVLAWTLDGFFQPVDMGGVINTVKAGSTVPLKFSVSAGTTALTDISVVESFVQTKIACSTSALVDEIEVTSTGGTTLRYDATAGQFIQNWQTPKAAGYCYRVTLTTDDKGTLVALFRLK